MRELGIPAIQPPHVLQFVVTGVPVQKGSMRAFVIKGPTGPRANVVADNSPQLKSWQHGVGDAARRAGAQVLEGPIEVRVLFRFLPPASDKKRKAHTVKPDLDKLVRAVLDGLTGVAFRDDAQVVRLLAGKEYAATAEAHVTVSEA